MRKLSGYGPSLIVLAAAALVLFAGPRAIQQLSYQQTKAQIIRARNSLEGGAAGGVLQQLNQAYRDIASVVEPSVVHVSCLIEQDPRLSERYRLSTGSGWVYDDQGHIVTNHHVIEQAGQIDVQLHNGEIREATLVGSDPTTDIAVLKIAPGRLHPAMLSAPSESVNQGDLVFAFGSPFDFRFSMSSGVVSGQGRTVPLIWDEAGRPRRYENFIQVDAAINPGNSGGPLTDYRGRVIGMNTAIASIPSAGRNGGEPSQFAGVGLAIPIDMIVPAVTQIIDKGVVAKGFLGVNFRPENLSASDARRLEFLGSGVLVTDVQPHSPAELAGIRTDDIVTHVNGRAISSSNQLSSMISSALPGDSATLTIWRWDSAAGTGEALEVAVKLERLDVLRTLGRIPEDQSRDSIVPLGIARMATSAAEIAQGMGVPFRKGVLIMEVVPGSALAASVPRGSTIVSVGDRDIADVEQFLDALGLYNLSRHGAQAVVLRPDGRPMRVALRVSQP